ncbi:hypothetical protein GQR58_030639 [Nymphon striatum]|nr:hypothetical protein GQR58_030639 [Nymphon striatum]
MPNGAADMQDEGLRLLLRLWTETQRQLVGGIPTTAHRCHVAAPAGAAAASANSCRSIEPPVCTIRRRTWPIGADVRFKGLVEHFAPKLVTQSFTISGIDRGTPFNNAAVDLYTLDANDLIIKKDTYWKHPYPIKQSGCAPRARDSPIRTHQRSVTCNGLGMHASWVCA